MEINFENKRVLVTGAGRGIGKAIATAFAKCKAEKVYALAKTKEDLEQLASEVPNIVPVVADLCDWDATKKAVEAVGRIDILINNAGVASLESFVDVKPESFDMVMSVNLKAMVNVSQVAVKSMIAEKKGGAIVSMSSQASLIALNEHTVYSASKAGIDLVTKTMALELGKHNIRANTVNPTVVMTDMGRKVWSDPKKSGPMLARIPLGKFAEIEDVVHAVLFLASDKAKMINGVSLPIDGGVLAN